MILVTFLLFLLSSVFLCFFTLYFHSLYLSGSLYICYTLHFQPKGTITFFINLKLPV